MSQSRISVCLVDPHAPDRPIVFANRAFLDLVGYEEDEVIGRNCRFLQGPGTEEDEKRRMARAIVDEEPVVAELLNYRKDGTTFRNAVHMGPIYDEGGRLAYFMGSQWDVTSVGAARDEARHARAIARQLSHRVKNVFAVIVAVVNTMGRATGMREFARAVNARVVALSRAYEPTLDAPSGVVPMGDAVRSVLGAYDPDGNRIDLRGPGASARDPGVDPNVVGVVGLVLHELSTDALRHGALSTDDGGVAVDWRPSSDGRAMEFVWTENGGPAPDDDRVEGGAGRGIARSLVEATGGRIDYDHRPQGLRVRFDVRTGLPA